MAEGFDAMPGGDEETEAVGGGVELERACGLRRVGETERGECFVSSSSLLLTS